jgi:hypothetical protein
MTKLPHEINGKGEALNPATLACIELLEHVLADAKAGNVLTVGIIACGPSDFGANIAGPNAQAVYMGCGVLQAKIVAAVTQPAPDMRPTILRPAPLGPRPVRRG